MADTTIGGIKYNGIDNAFGVDYYSKVLANMQSDAELVLLDFALNDKTQVLITLYNKVKEICEFSYDVITIDDVEALKRDSVGSQNKNDIEFFFSSFTKTKNKRNILVLFFLNFL